MPSPATATFVGMREALAVSAGSFTESFDDLVTGWHVHDMHQLQYAFEGVVEVETTSTRYLLPPQQAAWVPAGLVHQTTLRRVHSGSVFFEPSMVSGADDRVRVLAAAPVIREMIVYASRWPIDRSASDATADAFFRALALVAREWLEHEPPLCLPTSTDPLLRDVMAYTRDHLATVTLREVCHAVGVSERSLRRKFVAGTGTSWRRYALESRILAAMALLTEPDRTVADVAATVGFESISAFNRAFARYTHETPSAYRRRVAPRTRAG
jgi:AraC-like DNA-binding protein